ncbi:ATP-dependent endonuclease [Bosea sp. Root483D1]|uniref:ATP-dependent nuclease n=1 Tax=Bosea sp. Root483D1 TaxID=1736544 RepID=UPI00070CCCF4|nr:AAA family ATPase [Bosea sp. Root483D1]KRE13372.1 ATP-dependent endonuclease [Bosea sp. Root483D1]
MRISKIKIDNFANFSEFEIETGDNLVVVGENKVGKSNLIFALQLILDPGLSERDRQLGLEHFWDGLGDHKLGAVIEIVIELTDFEDDPRLLAHLGDCIVDPGPPMVSRLTYRFQPKADLDGHPQSMADYEYILFGGLDPDNAMRPRLRRMLPIDVLAALRDAEKDLATWRHSPLRPLIEGLTAGLDEDDRAAIQEAVDTAQNTLAERDEVQSVAQIISDRLQEMVGPAHATPISLGITPTRIDALLRALRLLIDGGARGIADASLGTANLIFLALKSLELDRLVGEGERDHTFLAVEEPEAHLHPHVQRLVYRHFLAEPDDEADEDEDAEGEGNEDPASATRLTTILTTHSPHIASIAPLRSLVLLRRDGEGDRTVGFSTANTPLTEADEADLQRYIDVTRGELFFARGVILVEGDAERFLVPAFAEALDIPLDHRGISVCSVGGTNFGPYVRLLGPDGLSIPYVVLTDRDPVEAGPPLARGRVQKLLEIVEPGPVYDDLADAAIFRRGERHNIFVNTRTLEPELFGAGLARRMGEILKSELPLRRAGREAIDGWVAAPATVNVDRLLSLIERVGKGRFAQRLAAGATERRCPAYIRAALERIRDAVA